MADDRSFLPEPAVPASAYDRRYYLEHAAGAEEFARGGAFAGRYHHVRDLLRIPQGGTFLDVGCGRGELVCLAAEGGASRSIGVEYAGAALELCRAGAANAGVENHCEFLDADARCLPFADAEIDRIAMLDVIEHLTAEEQSQALAELRRVLKDDGLVVLHTFPNRLMYSTYETLRKVWPGGRKWPVEPRTEHELLMHVGEVSARQLRRRLHSAGFETVRVRYTPWVYVDHLPSRSAARLLAALARLPGTRSLARASLIAEARP